MLADLAVPGQWGWLILLSPFGVLLMAWLRARVLVHRVLVQSKAERYSGDKTKVASPVVATAVVSGSDTADRESAAVGATSVGSPAIAPRAASQAASGESGAERTRTIDVGSSTGLTETQTAVETEEPSDGLVEEADVTHERDDETRRQKSDRSPSSANGVDDGAAPDLNLFSSRQSARAARAAGAAGAQFPSPSEPTKVRRANGVVPDSDVADFASELATTDLPAIEAEIADALAVRDQQALGILYLRHGVLLKRQGEVVVAGDVIRKSVGIAMQRSDARLHALGRLELGDIAAARGDLTTACEHWQLAKKMFLDVRQRRDSDVADGRMVKHGCPSEWVLTEF